ncbi:hypothetical protein D3C87_1264650 [compost metagenome]
MQIHHGFEHHFFHDRLAQQRRQALGQQRTTDRNAVLRMIVDEAHRAHVGLIDGQANVGQANRLGGMIENDLAGGRDDESDLVEGGGKGHREVATIMHAAETDPVVPAVDTADDDVFW